MIEPEMAFIEHAESLEVQEQYVAHIVQSVLQNCKLELERLGRDTSKLEKFKRRSHALRMMMQSSSFIRKALMISSGETILALHTSLLLLRAMTYLFSLSITQSVLSHFTCSRI